MNKSTPIPNYLEGIEDEDEIALRDESTTNSPTPGTSDSAGGGTTKRSPKKAHRRRSSQSGGQKTKDKAQMESFQSQLNEIFEILKEREDKNATKPKEKTPGKKRKAERPEKTRNKRRRTTNQYSSSETSETDSDADSGEDTSDPTAPGGKDYIPWVRFDMESATGKHAKNKKTNRKAKLRYPRPYMFLPRPILEEVQNRESYDDLSFPEYLIGLVKLMMTTHKEDDATTLLLNHLIMVADDATKFKWEAVRSFTNSCFDRAARSEITWRSKDDIREERIKLSWIAGPRPAPQPQPCHAFNTEGCNKEDKHVEGSAIMRHRCAVCWHAAGLYECTHTANRCNRREELGQKQTRPKQGVAGTQYTGSFRHNQYRSRNEQRGKEDQTSSTNAKN